MIIDDSPSVRSTITELLSEDYDLIEAQNGLEGLARVVENSDLDLIISDLNMPELDGLSMCQKIMEKKLLPNTPIVILTTECSEELKAVGKKVGVTAWMVKPIPNILPKLIESLLQQVG